MNQGASNIRVGLIRCDTHGMWFGAQMMEHDPDLLERAIPHAEQRMYTWMHRGVHYFFYTHYSEPTRMTAPRVQGFEITRLWDTDRRAAEVAARVFRGRPAVCNSFEQVSDDVDLVFIADCNGDGSDHLPLATPGIEKRVPTFIDKPFARCSADAHRILAMAEKANSPVMSLGILQTNPATRRFQLRLDEVGKVSFGSVTCFSMHPAALIHAICIVHSVFGTGIRTVRAVVAPKHTSLHLDYGERDDRPENGVMIHSGVSAFRFTEMIANAYGPEGAIQGICLDDFNAAEGSAVILDLCKQMVQTGRVSPLSLGMVQAVAVMEACLEAERTGLAIECDRDSRDASSTPFLT